jgi:uncharacterized protein YkwD
MNNLSWPDLIVAAIVALSIYLATRRGFITVLFSLVGFVVALFVAFNAYPPVAQFLTNTFGWTATWARPVAFVALWLIIEGIFGLLEALLWRRLGYELRASTANRWLAVIPGALQGVLTASVIVTMMALLPLQGSIRNAIIKSPVSGTLVTATLSVERPLEEIFGPAAREAQSFITIQPPTSTGESSHEGRPLDFTVSDATPDPTAEADMLKLVNEERIKMGLVALEMDPDLIPVARAHADDMFKRGYFSHDTPEGLNPFDRMKNAGIIFRLAGENLALAPNLTIAHNGLMNSPGHRANILKDGFRKVGIGVMDGGIFGKMFVQEFTD